MLESFPLTGCESGQMLPSGSTHGSSVFFGAAFFSAGFFAACSTRCGSGGGARAGAGSDATPLTGAGVSNGGHSCGAVDADDGSGFGRKIFAMARPMPVSNPTHSPIRNDRRITPETVVPLTSRTECCHRERVMSTRPQVLLLT